MVQVVGWIAWKGLGSELFAKNRGNSRDESLITRVECLRFVSLRLIPKTCQISFQGPCLPTLLDYLLTESQVVDVTQVTWSILSTTLNKEVKERQLWPYYDRALRLANVKSRGNK